MVSERAVGGLILAVFAIILVVYSAVLWVPGVDRYAIFAVKLITWIIVVGVSAIAIWLGWVMVSTKPIVPEEKPFESTADQAGGASESKGQGTAQPESEQKAGGTHDNGSSGSSKN